MPIQNHPTIRKQDELMEIINQALSEKRSMIGDLVNADAWFVAEYLQDQGFQVTVETEEDNHGAKVDSHDWKRVIIKAFE